MTNKPDNKLTKSRRRAAARGGRERTQARLAYSVVGLMCLMIVFGGLSALSNDSSAFERVRGIYQFAFGSIATLVASAFGYYFRGRG